MIEYIVHNNIIFQIDFDNPFRRFKAPTAKKTAFSPPVTEPAATQTEIIESAQKAGEAEGRRLRKRTGRRATKVASPSLAFVPAPIQRAGLSTTLA